MGLETTALKEQFTARFGPGGRLRVVRAPGRVNLIGEHTDYNDGFVMPMAIEPHVSLVFRCRDDGLVRIVSTHFPKETVEFSLQTKISPGEPSWANYFRGVAAELLAAGIPLVGMDVLLDNTLPVGGGLSSSAAIEIGMSLALLEGAGSTMDRSRIALLSQKAEHEYAQMPCGIMDQTIVATGRAGYAMLLDCRDLSRHYTPIDPRELRVVLVNSMAKHKLSGSEYPQRRAQCEEGVAVLARSDPKIKALRDATMAQLLAAQSAMPPVVFKRCRHVISENKRTTEAAALLDKRQYEVVGELMVQSHNSLRDDYEVSTPELDFLVAAAMKLKGVYGSRMTGAGFGGCTVSLVQPRHADRFTEEIVAAFEEKFGVTPDAFSTTAAAGASVVE